MPMPWKCSWISRRYFRDRSPLNKHRIVAAGPSGPLPNFRGIMNITLLEQSLDTARITYETHMRRDFPENELKPWDITVSLYERGIYEMLEIRWEGKMVGYAWIVCPKGEASLIDYLAVLPEYRNSGIGSLILKALSSRYQKLGQYLLLESEFPGEAPNPSIAVRRLGFYNRSGFQDTGVQVRLFGVRFCILSSKPSVNTGEQMRHIYKAMFPEDLFCQAVEFLK